MRSVQLIARYQGTGSDFFSVNLRVSKTFGFGPTRERAGQSMQGGGGGWGGPGGGGPGGGGAHGGGRGMPMGPRGGGMFGMGGDATSHRYNLVVALNARNLLNNVN